MVSALIPGRTGKFAMSVLGPIAHAGGVIAPQRMAPSTVSIPSPIESLCVTGHSLIARGLAQRPRVRRLIFFASAVRPIRWMPAGAALSGARNNADKHGGRAPVAPERQRGWDPSAAAVAFGRH